MSAPVVLPDREDRRAARLELGRSAVVEAGAGTGKTTLLIDRMAFLLLGSGLAPERLVALTFTEKAAGEIKARLAERLHALSALLEGRPAGTDAARACLEELEAWFRRSREELKGLAHAALRDLERAQIGTIHSFCARLLQLYPLEAGVPPDFRVDADGEAFEELFELEWALWLDRELGQDPPQPGLWRSVLARATLQELAELARGLAADPRIKLEELSKPSAAAAKKLKELANRARSLGEGRPRPKGNSRAPEYLAWMEARLKAAAEAVQGRPFRDEPSPTKTPSAWPKAWGEEDSAEYERLADLAAALTPAGEAAAAEAVRLLAPFVLRLTRAYRRRGWISFDGLLVAARDLVRDHPRVREELKARFGALLIDEFQDTDPLQGELLLLLAEEEGSCAPSWRQARLKAGKLFVVGDPKQSIYRFRGADIAAAEAFAGRIIEQGGMRLALRANFRSRSAILEAVNRVFSGVMAPKPGLQPPYVPIEPGRGGAPGEGPRRYDAAPEADEASAEEVRGAEADWIADWIVRERGEHALKDIAVVLRRTTGLAAYLAALKARGIPYVVEGEKYFYGTQEVCDFLNLLKAVDDPADRAALAGLLRSPLAALEDRELYDLARRGLLDYRRRAPGLEAFYALLRRFHQRAGREPLGDLLRALLRETLFVELCALAYHGQQTASNLLKFGRLAARASEGGMTLKEFISWVERSIDELREEGESPLADEDFDAVRVLTIHKAKGLEYPVVLLPDLAAAFSRERRGGGVRVPWGEGGTGLRLGALENAAMTLHRWEEKLRAEEEEARVLYVAMTRPKERLILLGGPPRRGAAPASLLDRAGCLPAEPAPAFPAAKAGMEPAEVRAKGPDPKKFAAAWRRRLEAARKASSVPLFARPTGVGLSHASYEKCGDALGRPTGAPVPDAYDVSSWSADETAPAAPSAALLGRLCHEVLQRWDFAAGRSLAGEDLPALCGRRAGWLCRQEPQADPRALAAAAVELVGRFLHTKEAAELAKAEILGREVPFLYPDGAQVVRGVMDLVYRKDGRWVVADYKTGRPSEREEHRRQGAFYVKAAEKALGARGVEFKLLFLRREDA